MADVRPFRSLHYASYSDLAAIICPPYDVISKEQWLTLSQRHPHNFVHIEAPQGNGDRYQQASRTLYEWLNNAVLQQDSRSFFYIYSQRFEYGGQSYERRAIFGATRLEPWEAGVIRPHERTLGPPKEDRMRLLRTLGINTSPVFALYRDTSETISRLLEQATTSKPIAEFEDFEGQGHKLWRLNDREMEKQLQERFAGETLYIADGHHRYETALAYRDEKQRLVQGWSPEQPENFVLMALTSANDSGLLLLPIHRLVRSEVPFEDFLSALSPVFEVETASRLPDLLAQMEKRGKIVPAIGVACSESPDLYLAAAYNPEEIEPLLPPGSPRQWRNLDTAVLQYGILQRALGVDEEAIVRAEVVQYTEEAEEALAAVREGRFRYAFFLNPLRPLQVLDLADTGQRLPQKSTFFYPKLPSGLVMNPVSSI